MLSKTAVHTVTALAVLAEQSPGAFVGAGQLARETDAPQNYLGKLLQDMADRGLLESQKGKGGGFRLVRNPSDISLFEVVDPVDHVSRWSGCFLGRNQCTDDEPCSLHGRWKGVRDAYLEFLRGTTVADVVRTRDGRLALTGHETGLNPTWG